MSPHSTADGTLRVFRWIGPTAVRDHNRCIYPSMFDQSQRQSLSDHVTFDVVHFVQKSPLQLFCLCQVCGVAPHGAIICPHVINDIDGCIQSTPSGPTKYPFLLTQPCVPNHYPSQNHPIKVCQSMMRHQPIFVKNPEFRNQEKKRRHYLHKDRIIDNQFACWLNKPKKVIVSPDVATSIAIIADSEGHQVAKGRLAAVHDFQTRHFYVPSPGDLKKGHRNLRLYLVTRNNFALLEKMKPVHMSQADEVLERLCAGTVDTWCLDCESDATHFMTHIFVGPSLPDISKLSTHCVDSNMNIHYGTVPEMTVSKYFPASVSFVDPIAHAQLIRSTDVEHVTKAFGKRGLYPAREGMLSTGSVSYLGLKGKTARSAPSPSEGPKMRSCSTHFRRRIDSRCLPPVLQ